MEGQKEEKSTGGVSVTYEYLNIGSGQRPFGPPFVNIDIQEKWKPDIVCDAAHLNIPGSSVTMIVLHHVLEHFGCGEANGLLRECYRVLKPRGSLLVFVPNIAKLASEWLTTKTLPDQLFFTNIYGAYMGDESDRHKWGYTSSSLGATLKQAGFSRGGMFDYRWIRGTDIAVDWWILGMEAMK